LIYLIPILFAIFFLQDFDYFPGKLHESRSAIQDQPLAKIDKNLNSADKQGVNDFHAISLDYFPHPRREIN